MTPTVPDGPDTELAAALAYFDNVADLRAEMRFYEAWGHAATIVRAYLTRPDGAPQHLVRGDRVETAAGARATVTGPAPRGPHGEPAVNLDWDGDAGGPAYEHDLTRVPASAAGRDLTAQDVLAAMDAWWNRDRHMVAVRLNGIARPAVARTDGQPPADEPHEGLTCAEHDVIDRAQAKVIREIGDLVDPDGKFLTVDLPGAVREALGRSAAPADDTAAPPAAPCADWSGAWAELTGYVRAATEPIDPARIDAYMVELKREALRPFREWVEQRGAGQPVRDCQDGGA